MNGQSSAEINAPIEVVFAVVADLERVPEWQPSVKVSRCLERNDAGRVVLLHTELETVIKRATAHLRLSYVDPTEVSWKLEEGNVPAFEGSWTLIDLGDGRTRAEYRLAIDFGRKLGMLLRGPAVAALEGAAVSSMPTKLKAFVEARMVAG